MKTLSYALIAALGLCASPMLGVAAAQEAGTMTYALGLGVVAPKDDNGALSIGGLDIGSDIRPTLSFEYFFRDNIGIEVLAAAPFKHGLSVGGAEIGEAKHLPPTVSINWHIPTETAFTPFVGLGVNYTKFFEEKLHGGGAALKIKESFGLAATLGVDYAVSEHSALRLDLRYIDISSDVVVDGVKIGKAEVDPLVAGIAWVTKF